MFWPRLSYLMLHKLRPFQLQADTEIITDEGLQKIGEPTNLHGKLLSIIVQFPLYSL